MSLVSIELAVISTRRPRTLELLQPHLCVAHAGGGHQGLLHRLALADPGGLLLALGGRLLAPVALNEKLDHFHMAPEGSVDQGALAVPVQVVHLLAGRNREGSGQEDLSWH